MGAERQEEETVGTITHAQTRITQFHFLLGFKRGIVWMMWVVPKSRQGIVFILADYRRRVRQRFIDLMDPNIFRVFSRKCVIVFSLFCCA
jgi:hypothetical protein